MNIQFAVTAALLASIPTDPPMPLESIMTEIEKNRPQIEAAIREQTFAALLYTYRSLTEAELEEYIAFATSNVGSRYHDAVWSGFKEALLTGSIRYGESIVKVLEELRNRAES